MRGPARFFLDHPLLYAVSLVGAAGAGAYAFRRAAVADALLTRLAMAALGAQCAAQVVGIVIETEAARSQRRPPASAP